MLRKLGLSAVALLTVSRLAAAEPIQITSGSLTWPGQPGGAGVVHITLGGGGFTFDGQTLALGSGVFVPSDTRDAPLVPGDSINLLARWSGEVFGTATLDGVTYNVGGTNSVGFEWTGTAVIPPGYAGGTVTAPFLFTGNFAYGTASGPLTRVFLTGSGTATVGLQPSTNPDFPNAFSIQSARYDFEAAAPTPEPATLLLLGSGVCAIAARRRRVRKSIRGLAGIAALAAGLAPAPLFAEPIRLISSERTVRAAVPPNSDTQQDADVMAVQSTSSTAIAAGSMTSDVSDLRNLSGAASLGSLTTGETFDAAPTTFARYTVVFELTAPQLYDLQGSYSVGALTTGVGGNTPANALVQFAIAFYDPVLGVVNGALFNDVYNAFSSTAGAETRSGVLSPGYYAFIAGGFADGADGFGTSSSSATFDFRFTLADAAAPTPEPASLLLLGTGVAGLAASRRKRSAN